MRPPRPALALAALLPLALAACSTSGQPAPPTTLPTSDRSLPASSPAAPTTVASSAPPRGGVPSPGLVDRSSPDAVGAAFVTTAWTMDTRTDPGPAAAGARAAALATPVLAAKLAAAVPQTSTSDWADWSAHHAFTKVQLVPDNDTRPDDTPATAYRAWTVTVTPQAAHWSGPAWHLTVYVTMTRAGGPWAVSDLKVS